MTTAEHLQRHIDLLREGIDVGVGDTALDELVMNVTHALMRNRQVGGDTKLR